LQDAPDEAEGDVPEHTDRGDVGQQGQGYADDMGDSVGCNECTRGFGEAFTMLALEDIER
jgi:hypothetical protein